VLKVLGWLVAHSGCHPCDLLVAIPCQVSEAKFTKGSWGKRDGRSSVDRVEVQPNNGGAPVDAYPPGA
jgi:hypothetical protein